ncbi:hypothetical protein ACSHT0_07640 [Tepidicaulis sp. LMO-SS28]|uniref:hypothetical protein n=1 Tax=Tepidicaulis sp. LMO-SS28 TaxID=3447455 RepID=UPI003EE0CA10
MIADVDNAAAQVREELAQEENPDIDPDSLARDVESLSSQPISDAEMDALQEKMAGLTRDQRLTVRAYVTVIARSEYANSDNRANINRFIATKVPEGDEVMLMLQTMLTTSG